MTPAAAIAARARLVAGEGAKLPAFLRRDLLVAWSYRVAFFSDFANLAAQMLVFAFVGQLVEAERLPSYGGAHATYLEFVTLGIVVNVFVQVALTRTATALRNEQTIGTLEALLSTPTATGTIQLGSAVFDVVYMPLRTALFLAFMAIVVGVDLDPSGALPAAILLLAFVPFVWGLGIASAAAVLTFRRGTGAMGIGALLLGLASGAFFPLDLLPGWIAALAEHNPLAIAIEGLRTALLASAGWEAVVDALPTLAAASAVTLAAGSALFRIALRRELRRGTLGLY